MPHYEALFTLTLFPCTGGGDDCQHHRTKSHQVLLATIIPWICFLLSDEFLHQSSSKLKTDTLLDGV